MIPTRTRSSENNQSLNTIQKWFLSVISHPEGVESGIESDSARGIIPMSRADLERVITASSEMTATGRLSIYANAYFARLIECLGESFPILKRTLGEEVFNGFAFGYLQHYPSNTYTLNELGRNLPNYLQETRPDREELNEQSANSSVGWPDFLIDLAKLEWTIEQVFDGPGIEGKQTFDSETLRGKSTDCWTNLRFNPVPCLEVLEFRFPVLQYFRDSRARNGNPTPKPPHPENSYLAVTRRDFVVRLHELSKAEFITLSGLIRGKTLGQTFEQLCTLSEEDTSLSPEEVQNWFGKWASAQFFSHVA